jgi:hypothetical protein
MPDLVGAVAEYTGSDDDVAFVSVDSIAAACTEFDTTVPASLRAIVGDACPGYFSSARAIFDRAQQIAQILADEPLTVEPCVWLDYYAPLIFRGSLNVVQYDPTEYRANWRLSAKQFRITGATVLPTGEVICYYGVWDAKEWLYKGVKPAIVANGHDANLCGDPHFDSFTVDELTYLNAPQGGNQFKQGSCSALFLSDETEENPPILVYTPGGPFMPIPPIPDGFPPLPSAPPLQGGAVVDALSDEDCATIVQRGGGFRSLADIAHYSDGASWEEFDNYCDRMLVPNERNYSYFIQLLDGVDDEVWNEIFQFVEITYGPIELQSVQNAFDSAQEDTKKNWLRSQLGSYNLLDIWQALALGGNETIVKETSKIILKEVADAPLLVPSVEVSSEITESTFLAELGPAGELYLVLKLAEEQMKNKTVTGLVRVADCEKDISFSTISLDDSAGVLGTPTYLERNNLAFFQWMADSLMMLKRCCNPCIEQHEQTPVLEFFWGHQTPNGEPPRRLSDKDYTNVDRVVFSVIRNDFPKKIEFGLPDLGLYAKVCWVNDKGEYGPIHYINIDQQELVPDVENMRGLMVHCYIGVELSVERFTKATGNPPHDYYNGVYNPTLNP